TSRAPATAASGHAGPSSPWSALSKMRARVTRRADVRPPRMRASNSARSSPVSVTRYTFRMTPLLGRGSHSADRTPKVNRDHPLEADTGRERWRLQMKNRVTAAAFSTDNQNIAALVATGGRQTTLNLVEAA